MNTKKFHFQARDLAKVIRTIADFPHSICLSEHDMFLQRKQCNAVNFLRL